MNLSSYSCSDSLLPPDYPEITIRHVALSIATWMLARIAEVVHDILRTTNEDGADKKESTVTIATAAEASITAGSTVPQTEEGVMKAHAWTYLHGSSFNVRCGPNYKKNGFKAPSGAALGKVEAMDVFVTERKIRHSMALGHIALPPATPGWDESYPEFLVITQMLPKKFNSAAIAGKGADGVTYMLLTYVRMPPNMAPGFGSHEDPQNAEQLLKRFLMRADQDPQVAHCWKMIGVVLNIPELERNGTVPSSVVGILKKWNGKPVLSRPQHEFFRDPQNRYLQADLDGHQYNYGTRTAVKHVLHLSRYLEMGYGYVVEARKEPELPEVMCCSCRVLKFELDKAMPFPPGASIPMD